MWNESDDASWHVRRKRELQKAHERLIVMSPSPSSWLTGERSQKWLQRKVWALEGWHGVALRRISRAVMPVTQKLLKVVSLLNSHISKLRVCRPELAIYRHYCRVHLTYGCPCSWMQRTACSIYLICIRNYVRVHSTVQSPSWAANGFAASQEIPRILWNPEGSLPHSQVPTTCPYREPALSIPYPHNTLPEDTSLHH